MRWLHPGRSLYHCHGCDRHLWLHQLQEGPDPTELADHRPVISDNAEMRNGNQVVLYCLSCGVKKTFMGRWWDDIWTSFRGHNKLFTCRHCHTVFSPPPP